MNANPPLNSDLPLNTGRKVATWTKPWGNWFSQILAALVGWNVTYYAEATIDFGVINAQTQATSSVSIPGASVGDVVVVRPTTALNGIVIDGTVSAADTVEVRAVNYSSGSINPASQVYSVLVFQQ